MATHTPGPWTVKFLEHAHRKGSPICRERCGRQGAVPIRIEQDAPDVAARAGAPDELEIHVLLLPDMVEDVVAADGTHVVCLGHHWDDHGYVSPEDARLIAAAPELLASLKVAVETLRIWHGFGHTLGIDEAKSDEAWALYQASPEMQTINAAIAKAEGR